MKYPLLMTPGPTFIHEDVRRAMAAVITNPDLDEAFFEFYRETGEVLKQIAATQNDMLILCGEGILGLEAACASLIEPGDRVLCIDNGIFGKGFGDFVKMYGGEAVFFQSDYRRAVDVEGLKAFLEKDHNFKLATVVHCETPSGITNPVDRICPLLKAYGILTVVDSVSAVGGEELDTDGWKIDILLGGSQKCLSAAPGLTFLSVSPAAWDTILQRKGLITGFYANLSVWKNWYTEKWFPYTQPVSDIYGLRTAAERLLQDTGRISRHRSIAEGVRAAIRESGLQLYPLDGFSNTVTALLIPDGVGFTEIHRHMLNRHNILIAGAFGYLKDRVLRIGHMGENCQEEKVYLTLKALNNTLKHFRVPLKNDLHKQFIKALE